MSKNQFSLNHTITVFRRMCYMVTPSETYFEDVDEMPNYYAETVPYLLLAIIAEFLIMLFLQKNTKYLHRANDRHTSLAFLQTHFLLGRHLFDVEAEAYVWVFEKYRFFTLPWNSPTVWYAALIGVDFLYYVFHRAAHEVAIMWAIHQAHHSSEDYNFSTAIRQHIFQVYTSTLFYLPLAIVGIPPTVVITHQVFNFQFQLWIHTELIDSLGPLEWVLNTPSHHRVHHGRNSYCIDKNYGGVLIVWDRLFGTFEAERKEDEVVYGLIENVNSFNPLYLQFFYSFDILFKKLPKMTTWGDRFKAIFYPPGWQPGHDRSMKCHDHEVPEIQRPVFKYHPLVPQWQKIYIIIHFGVLFLIYALQGPGSAMGQPWSTAEILKYSLVTILSLQCFGTLFDAKPYGPTFECARCALFFSLVEWFKPTDIGFKLFFGASALIWLHPVQRAVAAATENTQLKQFMTMMC